jgi:hypothetical protein
MMGNTEAIRSLNYAVNLEKRVSQSSAAATKRQSILVLCARIGLAVMKSGDSQELRRLLYRFCTGEPRRPLAGVAFIPARRDPVFRMAHRTVDEPAAGHSRVRSLLRVWFITVDHRD